MGLDTRMRLARLYLCTDAREEQGDLEEFLRAVFAGGVDIVQIRQKNMAPARELDALNIARRVAFDHQGLVCVNDSPELAGEFQSDVLHLGQTDGKAKAARKHLHEWAQIGRSTHSEKQARKAAEDDEVDYFCVGPVYPTATKPDYEAVGLDLVRYATELQPPSDPASKPWFAIGGINADNLDEVLDAGAKRICVVRPITEAADPEAAAAELKNRLREAWKADPEMEKYTFAAFRPREKAPKK